MTKAQRSAILEELTNLNAKGRLTPASVLRRARNENSPMHSYFEWDDAEAAEKFRIEQARTLISDFEIKYTVGTLEFHAPAFVRDPTRPAKEQGYVAISDLQADPHKAAAFMRQQLDIAQSHVDRTVDFSRILDLEEETVKVGKKLENLRAQVAERAEATA